MHFTLKCSPNVLDDLQAWWNFKRFGLTDSMQCDCYTICPPLSERVVVKVTRGAIGLRAGVQVLRALDADTLPGSPSRQCWHLTHLKCTSHLIASVSLWIKQRQLLIVRCILKICSGSNDWNRYECVFDLSSPAGFLLFTENITHCFLNNVFLVNNSNHSTHYGKKHICWSGSLAFHNLQTWSEEQFIHHPPLQPASNFKSFAM